MQHFDAVHYEVNNKNPFILPIRIKFYKLERILKIYLSMKYIKLDGISHCHVVSDFKHFLLPSRFSYPVTKL